MKTITIARIKDGAASMAVDRSPKAVQLLGAIEASRKAPVKVYTTDVARPGKPFYVISTGSKEIHLELGRMGWEARYALVELIDQETSISSELLVVFKNDDGSRGLICTKQVLPDNSVRITLQVAND